MTWPEAARMQYGRLHDDLTDAERDLTAPLIPTQGRLHLAADTARLHLYGNATAAASRRPHRPVPGMRRGRRHRRAIGAFTRSPGVGFFPGGRVASRRSPSTPRARKRSRRRRTVGFDTPVRRMVPAGPQPEPGSGTMRARQTCFRRLRGLLAACSRRARSASGSTIACPSVCPPPVMRRVMVAAGECHDPEKKRIFCFRLTTSADGRPVNI